MHCGGVGDRCDFCKYELSVGGCMEREIGDSFVITDVEVVEESIEHLTGTRPDIEKICAGVEAGDNRIYYLDGELRRRDKNDKSVSMVWIDSGEKTGTGDPIMISLLKRDGKYEGYFVGAPYYLVKGMSNRFPNRARLLNENLAKFMNRYNGVQVEEDSENVSSVAEEIWKQSLFQKWKSINGLDRFIKIIGKRILQLVEQERTEYYVMNNIKSVIVNTGMMNIFGKDFLVMYKYNLKWKSYVAECVVRGKQDFLDYRFTKEQASGEIKPISFFDDDQVFAPTMDDFDLNQESLTHIVQNRSERFPESLREQSDAQIANLLISELERGVHMQLRDHTFAKASYSGNDGEVSWFLPLHVNAALNEKPELVMAIKKTGDFYEVKTILPFNDEMEDRFTALSLYNGIWS